ncbi:MAG: hypothetical protein Q9203_006353 [Teloschistes exilis]
MTTRPIERLYYDKFFNLIVREVGQLQTIREVTDFHMAHFFATYVQRLRKNLDDIEQLRQVCEDLSKFWGFCRHLSENPQRTSMVFQLTIGKLGVSDIPLCLWMFVAVTNTDTKDNASDEDLCSLVEVEINGKIRFPHTEDELRWLSPVVVTINFLLHTNDGFYEVLGPLMERCYGKQRFESVRRVLCKQPDYSQRYESLAILTSRVKIQVTNLQQR